ncbi:hypothetical protein C9446_13945 [Providencia heimbachae]|uniref:hypothetical protein n=1 Tax=Providencia heimbachae TaxID=333962 RepID=UPI0010BF0DF8|nr:hypothetical protein [Providencia heimbachae]QCJ70852.1 hypothetical protein C9446_13945 [Providencia heimbachae]
MPTKILYLLCILLLALLSFVLGASFSLHGKAPSIIDGAKLTVSNFMYQPQAADFKNVKFYASGTSMKHKSIGNVCGEVLTFKEDAPYRHKKFIVQVAEDMDGESIFSFPLFDFEGQVMPEEEFQKIWGARCK